MSNNEVIEEVFQKIIKVKDKGNQAFYIPELALVDSNKFGVHISNTSNLSFG